MVNSKNKIPSDNMKLLFCHACVLWWHFLLHEAINHLATAIGLFPSFCFLERHKGCDWERSQISVLDHREVLVPKRIDTWAVCEHVRFTRTLVFALKPPSHAPTQSALQSHTFAARGHAVMRCACMSVCVCHSQRWLWGKLLQLGPKKGHLEKKLILVETWHCK